MKLGIIIDTDLRIPPFTGVTYRLYYLAKELTENGIEVSIFLCNRNIKNTKNLNMLRDDSTVKFHIIPEHVFYNVEKMFYIIAENRVDVLRFEDAVSVLRYQNIFLRLKLPVCLELHDIDMALRASLGHGRRAIHKALITTRKAVQLSDAIICMTPYDYKELRNRVHFSLPKQYLVPNPIDLDTRSIFDPNTASPVVLFIGNMFYWPNLHAVEYIVHNIIDRVITNNKKTKFLFVGAISKQNKHKLKRRHAVFTDRVKNLDPYLKRSTLALCPVTEGSGMKVKILDYCSAAIPVITTTIGSSGYEHVKSLFIENNLDHYPEIINSLLKNKAALKRAGVRNRSYVKKYYDISKISLEMKKIYLALSKKGAHSKHLYRDKHVPPPLWLEEGRVKKIKNDNYYIIQHGKLLSKKSTAAHLNH